MTPAQRLATNATPYKPRVGDSPVRYHRRLLHLPLVRVAESLGLSVASLSTIERGETRPNLANAIRIGRFYGVSVEELFGHLVPDSPRSERETAQDPLEANPERRSVSDFDLPAE